MLLLKDNDSENSLYPALVDATKSDWASTPTASATPKVEEGLSGKLPSYFEICFPAAPTFTLQL